MKQKYVFPLNYDYSGKLLGMIDYALLLPLAIYGGFLFFILKLFSFSLLTKIALFLLFFLPIALMLNSRVNSEPFYQFIFAVIRHYSKAKKYLYQGSASPPRH